MSTQHSHQRRKPSMNTVLRVGGQPRGKGNEKLNLIAGCFLFVAVMVVPPLAQAAPVPEECHGVVETLTPQLITLKTDAGLRRFSLRTAGVCGWPTRKKVHEVFRPGDLVIVYHFGDPDSEDVQDALNVFFQDEKKNEDFQRSESR